VQKTRKRRRPRRRAPLGLRDLIARDAYGALRDESYSHIQRAVEELLKDPDVREKIDAYARVFLKAILAKL
jgi:hypothetical protein